MAKRLVLVPENWLTKFDNENVESPTFKEIVDSFPKRLQKKVQALVDQLGNRVKIDSNQRVVYDDGEVGSNIVDLIRYSVSPSTTERPIDAPRFDAIMKGSQLDINIHREDKTWLSL
jgi:hypothetical protein